MSLTQILLIFISIDFSWPLLLICCMFLCFDCFARAGMVFYKKSWFFARPFASIEMMHFLRIPLLFCVLLALHVEVLEAFAFFLCCKERQEICKLRQAQSKHRAGTEQAQSKQIMKQALSKNKPRAGPEQAKSKHKANTEQADIQANPKQ